MFINKYHVTNVINGHGHWLRYLISYYHYPKGMNKLNFLLFATSKGKMAITIYYIIMYYDKNKLYAKI